MPKSIETEIKIKIHNLQKISEKLKLLGFHIKINRSFEDNWIFDSPNQDLSRRHWLLRIRTFNNRAWITLKTPSENSNQFKVREELEFLHKKFNLELIYFLDDTFQIIILYLSSCLQILNLFFCPENNFLKMMKS